MTAATRKLRLYWDEKLFGSVAATETDIQCNAMH